jgi:hypothetical protein
MVVTTRKAFMSIKAVWQRERGTNTVEFGTPMAHRTETIALAYHQFGHL